MPARAKKTNKSKRVDSVRASKDGHQFHEAWVARRALGLLLPRFDLYGIAVEGLSEEDEEGAPASAVEIADATFYYGNGTSFESCARLEVAQFKYSVANADTPLRIADLRKTLAKFAATEKGLLSKHGAEAVARKVTYSINSNRPFASEVLEAFRSASTRQPAVSADAVAQLSQLRSAVKQSDDGLRRFAERVVLIGRMDSLEAVERGNARTVADWSASNDALARARIGDLRDLVRKKAGSQGQRDKVVTQVDVLSALGLGHESELLPTPQAFPEVGDVVRRAQLSEFIATVGNAPRWIVQASGGLGKTVFVQSVAAELAPHHEVVLFDCFGGGAYRTLMDGRHRPERGLLHVVNELACRGLCDPILPGTSDSAEVVRRSIHRFKQAIEVLRRTKPHANLFVIIDAADNAAMEASHRHQWSFPRELLESLTTSAHVEGLTVVATARPERVAIAIGNADCRPFEIKPFTLPEAGSFISARRTDATPSQIEVVHHRAEGNPRVIANLIEPDRDLVSETQTDAKVELNDLIQERIARAVQLAELKGANPESIAAFLCALSLLPPPVPVGEAAIAFGVPPSEIESFAADLAPLLDRTRHGIIFRDEPTETFVSQRYGAHVHLLNEVVARLTAAQSQSVYAARSLPGLLSAMGRVEDLHRLAFDITFPATLTGDVAKRVIKLNRLRTALGAAARARRHDAIVDMLVELSTVVAVDERGQDYLLMHPDLVVALGDSEALRRLFESKTAWAGSRHARLTTAYTTDGDLPEALVHGKRTEEWIQWLWKQDEQDRFDVKTDVEDFVGIASHLVASGRTTVAASYMGQWRSDAYSYRLATRLVEVCTVSHALGKMPNALGALGTAADCRRLPPSLVAAIFKSLVVDESTAAKLLSRLMKAVETRPDTGDELPEYREVDSYQLALQRCALRAAQLQLDGARALADRIAPKRIGLWSLRDPFSTRYTTPWVLSLAARAAADLRMPTLFDCVPTELWTLVKDESPPASDEEQLVLLQERLKVDPAQGEPDTPQQISGESRRQASDGLRVRIPAVLALAKRIARLVSAGDAESRSVSLAELFDGWKSAVVDVQKDYRFRTEDARFIDTLYSECALQVLIALNAFNRQTAAACLEWMGRAEFTPVYLFTELVAGFARNADTAEYAGTIAAKTAALIGRDDDVVQRANLLARLARAILPADRTEATALFTRGLADLDAIGSGDYAFTNELLWFAKSVAAGPLAPDVAHRLAKICELNLYDSRKFPWTLAAAAFSRCWGAGYLAQLSRWHDRDKAELSLTLPPALSFLVRDRTVRPDDALAMLQLVEPEVGWDWDWDHFVESITDSRPEALGTLLNELLSQFERAYPKRPHVETVSKMRSQVATAPGGEPLCDELDGLLARSTQTRRVQRGSDRANYVPATKDDEVVRKQVDRKNKIAAAVNATNPLSVASIETLVNTLDVLDRALDVKTDAFATLRAKVAYVDRSQHIGAIVSARNLELFAKNKLLASLRTDWLSSSPSELSVLKDSGTSLIRQHASELVAKEWGSLYELRELSQLSGTPHHELAIALVDAAATDELETASTVWLRLATDISPKADPNVPRAALSRLLNSGAARLADEVGDGGWTSALQVDGSSEAVTAGLIWFCLGLPHARDRWRAAHAVRTLARLGRWTVIDQLFERLDASGAGPFQDQRLPFFTMHAQQWFLLAIARIALDHPREIRRHRKRLEAVAFNDRFPDVGLREPARRALMSCLKGERSKVAARTIRKLQKVHVSAFRPVRLRINTFGTMSWSRSKTARKPRLPFHFDYDFDKHDLSRVGNMFGLPTWKIADRCVSWIRKWDPKIEYMHDFGGRERPSGNSNYTTGAEESFQSYGAYLARHALALTAGRLLLTTPLSVDRYALDRWDEWLARYSPTRDDGLWVSDGLGRVPDFALHDLMQEESEGHQKPSDDQTLLRSLAGVAESRIPNDLMVDGSWSSPDGVRVNVSSAMVPPDQSSLASRAVVTSPLMDMWLPSLEPGEDDNGEHVRLGREVSPLEPWITEPHVELRIDDSDPFGVREALQRPRPATRIIRTFHLRPEKPWADSWLAPGKRVAFRSRAWGRRVGTGDREDSDSGAALFATRPFLADLLAAKDRDLLILIKLEHYRQSEQYNPTDDEPGDRFTHTYSLLLIDRNLRVRSVVPASEDIATVAGLDRYSRHDFQKRLAALSQLRGA